MKQTEIKPDYTAVRAGGAGLLDLAGRGLLEVSGGEAVQFLNGLITNDVKTLENNRWMLAAFPNVKGRLLALVRVWRADDKFYFDTEPATKTVAFNNLFRFTYAGDFHVRDLSGETACLSIQGKDSNDFVHGVFGEVTANLERSKIVVAKWNDQKIVVLRDTHTAEDGFDLFVPQTAVEELRGESLRHGVVPVADETAELLRIEAGLPKYNVDVDENTVVLETGLDQAVSFQKGCYIGQEIIARIHFRGHVAKQLSGLVLDENIVAEPGDELQSPEGKSAGKITSIAFSPALNKRIALAMVRYDFLTPETQLLVVKGDQKHRARVTALPFVKGSWRAESQAVNA